MKKRKAILNRLLPKIQEIQKAEPIRTRRYPGAIRKSIAELIISGISLGEMAKITGIGPTTMRHWIHGGKKGFREVSVRESQKEKSFYTIESSAGFRLNVQTQEDAISIFKQL